MAARLEALQQRAALRFRRPELLREAMTHASWNNERGRPSGPGHDNERLEYLGDAVLELVVGEHLFRRYPDYDEGLLTQLRASLVNTQSLARLAEKLQIGDALLLGKGAAKTQINTLPRLLANGFEALIGAIFLDQGYRVATRVFLQNVGDLAEWTDENHKGRLQEVAQERTGGPPRYRTAATGGPGHRRQYTAEALVGSEVMGTGSGPTKQAAEQAAARAALAALEASDTGRPAREPRRTTARGGVSRSRRRRVEAEIEAAAEAEAIGSRRRTSRGGGRAAAAKGAQTAASAGSPGRVEARAEAAPPLEAGAAPGAGGPASERPPGSHGPRRRGLLSVLRTAAEVLIGRPGEAAPAPRPTDPLPARTSPDTSRASTPRQRSTPAQPAPVGEVRTPATRGRPGPAAGVAADAGADTEAATPGSSRSRRGRRGGRGRRRPAAGAASAAGGSPPSVAPPGDDATAAPPGGEAASPQRPRRRGGARSSETRASEATTATAGPAAPAARKSPTGGAPAATVSPRRRRRTSAPEAAAAGSEGSAPGPPPPGAAAPAARRARGSRGGRGRGGAAAP